MVWCNAVWRRCVAGGGASWRAASDSPEPGAFEAAGSDTLTCHVLPDPPGICARTRRARAATVAVRVRVDILLSVG